MSELDHGTHGQGFHGGGSLHDLIRSPGKRTRTQDLPGRGGGAGTSGTTGGGGSHGAGTHAGGDPYDFDFDDGITIFGVKLTGNSGGGDFARVERLLGDATTGRLRGAAGRGPDDVLRVFEANGVVIDGAHRTMATAVAEAYMRWVELDQQAADLAHHDGGTGTGGLSPAQGGGGGGGVSLDTLREAIDRWGIDVELERYAEVELDVSIPTEVPELMLDLGGKLRFARKPDGELELEATMKTGASWNIFKLLNVSIARVFEAKLQGKDLGAAFVDCLKQTVRTVVKAIGVEAQLVDLRRMAAEGPTRRDYVDAFESLIPVFGKDPCTAGKIAIATLGGDHVVEAIDAYFAYFADDVDCGFKVSIGQEVSLKSGKDAFLTGGVALGIEEGVGDTEGTLFAEGTVKGKLKKGEIGIELSFTGRADREGGHFTVGFELEAPWRGAPLVDAAHDLATSELFRAALARIAGGESTELDGAMVLDVLGNGVMNAATSLFTSAVGVHSMVGLGVEITFDAGGWEKVEGTARTITEAELDADLVGAKLSTGTQLDVSKELEAAMPQDARALR